MENTLDYLASYIPSDLDIISMVKFIAMIAAGALILGFIGRMALGKRSELNHAVSSAMGILFIYIVTIVVYTFNPADLTKFLSPLPFAAFYGESLVITAVMNQSLPAICSEVLSLVILAFLVNLLDTFIPKGKKILSWYLWRFVSVVLAMALHYAVTWVFNAFLPDVLVTYAPMILLGILIAMLLLGVAKALLGLVLTVANPIIGAIYTFFFASLIGKQLSKAVLTTILLCAVFYALEFFGFGVISIAVGTLGNYIPLMAALLILWYLVGHVL